MASSGYVPITFVAGEQPTTAKWNLIGSNDASFNNGNGIEDGAIIARHMANQSVGPSALALGPAQAYNQELGTMNLTSTWGNLQGTAVGPAVTVTVGVNGILLVHVSALVTGQSGTADYADVSYSLTGANILDPDVSRMIRARPDTTNETVGNQILLTGLNPGVTTVTMKYQTSATTTRFEFRRIMAIPF